MGDQQRCCSRLAPPPPTAAAAGRSPGALVEQARGCSRWGAGEQAGGEQGPAGEGCRPSGAPHANAPLPLTYVQVQMVSSSTTRKDEKEKRALMGQGRGARVGAGRRCELGADGGAGRLQDTARCPRARRRPLLRGGAEPPCNFWPGQPPIQHGQLPQPAPIPRSGDGAERGTCP